MLSTATKIKAARVLYRLLKLADMRDEQIVTRSGVRYQLDLREGIDLAIFIFGGFQNHVAAVSPGRADAVIFDVGANCGAITLAMAKRNPRAHIHSFEPTHYALKKLQRNLALNPELTERVKVTQAFVGRRSGRVTHAAAYASWRVDAAPDADAHAAHAGVWKEATTAMLSLDDYAADQGIARVGLLKIDTDGQELAVLAGAERLVATSRPRIVMEMCPYLMAEQNLTFRDYADMLGPAYRMTELRSGRPLDAASFAGVVPFGGIDVLAEVD